MRSGFELTVTRAEKSFQGRKLMSPRQMFRAAAAVAIVLSMSAAHAQFYRHGCGPVAACTPIQPVRTTCYQDVPVTMFRHEKQTLNVHTLRNQTEYREYIYFYLTEPIPILEIES